MESIETRRSNKIEAIEAAIKQLIQSNQTPLSLPHVAVAVDDRHLLTNLLSQLESLKGDGDADADADANVKLSEQSVERKAKAKAKAEAKSMGESKGCCCEKGADIDIVKQLKKLERQNRTTHWLISALIFVTVTWQISEVSLLLKLKRWLNHPLRSFGGVVTGALKPDDKESSAKQSGLGFIYPIG